jgi:glutamate racemase
MQLKAWDRRDVIEDLLDIGVFSKMKNVLKVRNSQAKETAKGSKISLDGKKDQITYQKKHISQLDQINIEAKQSFDTDIEELQTKIDRLKVKLDAYPSGMDGKLKSLKKVKDDLSTDKGKCNHEIKSLEERHKFFEVSVACPVCSQAITEDLKTSMVSDIMAAGLGAMNELSHTKAKLSSAEDALECVRNEMSEVRVINAKMTTYNNAMSNLINKQVNEVDIQGPNSDLLIMQNEADDIREILDKATDELLYNDVASEMLKDTGIRTKIIREYLPAMNTLINKYLQVLEFFVAFHLDENFQETIKSRHRDKFVYDNFSEGEKMRIDLSLLFAWRQIAKMKNSTNTNLLLLDETFDSSLDEDGVDNLMKILLTLEDGTNTFIISHKPDMLEGKLKDKLVFTKRNNFSEIS